MFQGEGRNERIKDLVETIKIEKERSKMKKEKKKKVCIP